MLVMVPVGMVVGVMVVGVYAYFVRPVYESVTLVEVRRNYIEPEGAPIKGPVERYCGVEIEKFKGRNNLLGVSERLDLMGRWGMDQDAVLERLKKAVQVEEVKGTDLYRLRVRVTNREEAMELAWEVVKSYGEWRKKLEEEAHDREVQKLERMVSDQEAKIEDIRRFILEASKANESLNELNIEEAESDLEEEQISLHQIKTLILERINDRRKTENRVIMLEESVIADFPLEPHVRLMLGMGVGALVSPFFALPFMAFLNGRSKRDGGR
jgi:hypothetical protein